MMFAGIYNSRRVLVTGHTGFKGSWLVYWLRHLGAQVCGYSRESLPEPSHWNLLGMDIRSEIADVLDVQALEKVITDFQPEIVFHLAAQSLVRASYLNPVETYSTNVIGTLNVFEACRKSDSVRAIINVTSDKCYENKEWVWGYRENDTMGGHDPYSSSKSCSELLTQSYRNSYFNIDDFGEKHQTLLASCRAGNVIGGGDWAKDRLIADIMRASDAGEQVVIRNPSAIRPWQHVLEPLRGYLLVGQKLLEGKAEASGGWNFGPSDSSEMTVKEVVRRLKEHWDEIDYCISPNDNAPHEANLLKLDCSKAHKFLKWSPIWSADITLKRTVEWYRNFFEHGNVTTSDDLDAYIKVAEAEEGLNG